PLTLEQVAPAPAESTEPAGPTVQSRDTCDLGRNNSQEVIGHDVADSVELPGGRVLFVFGDTWLGHVDDDGNRQVREDRTSSGATLPAGAGICDELTYLTDAEGEVRKLIPVRPGDDPERYAHWPVAVAVGEYGVVVLYRRIDRGPSEDPLDFRVLGTGLALANPDTLDFFLLEEGRLLSPEDDAEAVAIEIDPATGQPYVISCRHGPASWTRECLLARPSAPDAPFGPTEYWSDGIWSTDLDEATQILPNGADEMSLERVEWDGVARWVVVYIPPLTCEVHMQVADEPWGPYSDPIVLHEGDPADGSYCYGGKLQRSFSDAGRVVVTWVNNGTLRETYLYPDLYWPHVAEVEINTN
ncbi:MAG: DUF4185 domain-containing protein, partial [Dehalococcoidia bacterium]|nr:DUF4185 domain-containing protein [Dehalococcoidia bacterium]